MSKIQVLDPALANQIAAGEVVERPSSVVKELVENSIDAKAHTIRVEILEAGRGAIIVDDDGLGMDREDAILAFERHATSKIHDAFDLFRIRTLGFRGEALPSIASVSRLTLVTSDGQDVGTKITFEDQTLSVSNAPLRQGTRVEVAELFYHTPARLKYLKKDATENASTIEVMTRIALAHPEISLTLTIDQRQIFQTSGRGQLLETIGQIYGFDVAKKMIPFHWESSDMEINGYLGAPEMTRANRYHMIVLLNGRSVYMPKVQNAILESYHDFIPPSRYPFVILQMNVDCALVDVNVHPSKREVRFSKEEEVRQGLFVTIPQVLREAQTFVDVPLSSRVTLPKEEGPIQSSLFEEAPTLSFKDPDPLFEVIQEPGKTNNVEETDMLVTKEEPSSPSKARLNLRAIAQLQRMYIVAEDDDGGFYLVDQHAAYERIQYEKFRALFAEEIVVREPLVPHVIHLSPADINLFQGEKQKLLQTIGLSFEPFGPLAYKVTSLPTWLLEGDEQAYIDDLVDQALHGDRVDVLKLRTHAIATMSCKASVRANDRLDLREMQYILDTLMQCENPTCCPHGRPTLIHFTRYELEKLFKRTGV